MSKFPSLPALLFAAGIGIATISSAYALAPADNVVVSRGTLEQLMPVSELIPLIGATGDNYVQKLEHSASVRVFDLPALLSPAELTQIKTAEASHMSSVGDFQQVLDEYSDVKDWLDSHGAPVDRIVGMSEVGNQIEIYLY